MTRKFKISYRDGNTKELLAIERSFTDTPLMSAWEWAMSTAHFLSGKTGEYTILEMVK